MFCNFHCTHLSPLVTFLEVFYFSVAIVNRITFLISTQNHLPLAYRHTTTVFLYVEYVSCDVSICLSLLIDTWWNCWICSLHIRWCYLIFMIQWPSGFLASGLGVHCFFLWCDHLLALPASCETKGRVRAILFLLTTIERKHEAFSCSGQY